MQHIAFGKLDYYRIKANIRFRLQNKRKTRAFPTLNIIRNLEV